MHKPLPPLAPARSSARVRRLALPGALPVEILMIGAAFLVLIFG